MLKAIAKHLSGRCEGLKKFGMPKWHCREGK